MCWELRARTPGGLCKGSQWLAHMLQGLGLGWSLMSLASIFGKNLCPELSGHVYHSLDRHFFLRGYDLDLEEVCAGRQSALGGSCWHESVEV